MQFSLTFCTLFYMLSKHLEFLSFQTAHQIIPGIFLHLPLTFACTPASSQHSKASATFLGIVHDNGIAYLCYSVMQM